MTITYILTSSGLRLEPMRQHIILLIAYYVKFRAESDLAFLNCFPEYISGTFTVLESSSLEYTSTCYISIIVFTD